MKRTALVRAALAVALLASPTAALADSHNNDDDDSDGPEIDLPPPDPPIAPRARIVGVSTNTVNIGGYGELHFNRVIREAGENTSEIDFHRMVVYFGRQFNDQLSFYSEIEIEHSIAGDGKPGEATIEQAYIDYQLTEATDAPGVFGVRAGIVLVPMGIVNQWHEPPIFHGVERPRVDNVIIPTTWREGGAGVFGRPIPELGYELYVVGGLDPAGFSSSSGLRGGRQKVGEARADGLAVTGRLEYKLGTGSVFGLAGYFSAAGKNNVAVQNADLDVTVLGVGADARTRWNGVEARAVFAAFQIGDADELGNVMDADGEPITDVGDSVLGGYGELAYDVLHTARTRQQLLPFFRYEYTQTHPDMDARKTSDFVFGLSYRPVPQVVFKSDVIFRRPQAGDNTTLLDLGVGFLY